MAKTSKARAPSKKSADVPVKEWPVALKNALKKLPTTPGVYEMVDAEGETLYVGKAKDLRKRVQSYFRPAADLSPRIRKMVEKTVDLRWTEVSSEVEALLLEANLIKEKYPKFNVLLRDDKNFSYFCISVQEDFPRITLTRRIVKDGSIYIGPKTSAGAVRETIDLLHEIFQFRSTNLEITEITPGKVDVKNPGNIKYPCLNFHIGKCRAPCIGNIAKAEYRQRIDQAVKFLRGNTTEIVSHLKSQMFAAAEKKQFERAARLRDLLGTVQSISEKQIISAPDEFCADVIGMVEKFGRGFFHLFQIREGKVINSETFSLPLENAENASEGLFAFLREYAGRTADYPDFLILSEKIFPKSEQGIWEEFFSNTWQQKLEISLPQKAKRQKLLELAEKNALSFALRNAASFIKAAEEKEDILQTLQQKLQMNTLPARIECFDISHLGGTETVAAMTVMVDGQVQPKDYRRFQLRTLDHGQIDDFKSMQEVLLRRLRHIPVDERGKNTETVFEKSKKSDQAILQKIIEKNRDVFLTTEIDFSDFFVARKKGKIISCARLTKHTNCLEIKSLWVDAKTRGEKLGQSLIRFILEKVKKEKVYVISGDPNLREYYEEIGFREVYEPPLAIQREITAFIAAHPECIKGPKALVMMYDPRQHKKDDALAKKPNLIVIDGGKGQLSAAQEIVRQFSFAQEIALCSLAKRFEEVYVPGNSRPIAITADSAEGKLLQSLRDEAHRFAVGYQQKLHQKNQQKSELDTIPGIGPKMKKKLLQKFGSVSGIRNASDRELQETVGEKATILLRQKL